MGVTAEELGRIGLGSGASRMSLGSMTDEKFAELHGPSEHPAGCTYGGFSCGYWLVVEDCEREHWERHIVLADGTCPCGNSFPGASNTVVFYEQADNPPDSEGEESA